eukprot:CAMPEP_0117593032 /NCGR_PEP_ID=MMETSP0784-20121206/72396_1 /TAXON_ID=39447 /ORGANISM="" /LENGTH=31 /DNA_ID= /DNA_START= /DNA_END= /DNA_ORIENTATION=
MKSVSCNAALAVVSGLALVVVAHAGQAEVTP